MSDFSFCGSRDETVFEAVFGGEIDDATSSLFLQAIMGGIEESTSVVITDLLKVRYFDASGVAALLKAQTVCREQGSRLFVVCDAGEVLNNINDACDAGTFLIFPTVLKAKKEAAKASAATP